MKYESVRPQDRITFLIPNGNGRDGQEYTTKTGKVVMVFPTHVVVNGGGRHGTPYVVTEENFVK